MKVYFSNGHEVIILFKQTKSYNKLLLVVFESIKKYKGTIIKVY